MKRTPEEIVRQSLILQMTERLGYPKALLSIEKKLSEVCRFSGETLPNRRLDILCFSKKELEPLLMVECKAITLTEKAIEQVIGYNRYVAAKFVCLANMDTILTGHYDRDLGSYRFQKGLPSYQDLMKVTRSA